MKYLYCVISGKYRKLKNLTFAKEKTLVLSIICSKCRNEEEKCLKKNNQLRY